jgi:hypothetical protein
MLEERYHATTHNQFYPDMPNVNKNMTVEAKLISPPTYNKMYILFKIYNFNVNIVNMFSVCGRKNVLLVRNVSLLYVICSSVESLLLVAVLWQ